MILREEDFQAEGRARECESLEARKGLVPSWKRRPVRTECHSAMEQNEALTRATVCLNLQRSQGPKVTHRRVPCR